MIRLALVAIAAGAVASVDGAPAGARREIVIREFAFKPESIVVAPGDTIVWINRDILPHTTKADSGAWKSGELAPGASFTWIASTTKGERRYHCAAHPGMTGTLIVR